MPYMHKQTMLLLLVAHWEAARPLTHSFGTLKSGGVQVVSAERGARAHASTAQPAGLQTDS